LNLGAVGGVAFLALWRRGRKLSLAASPGIAREESPSGLRVFLCQCSEDKAAVRQPKERLESDAYQPWLDEQDIFPAHVWDDEIQQALRSSHAVVVCLSRVFEHKEGFVQKELRYALKIAEEKPDGTVFLIPARLEDCRIPNSLRSWQCIDLFVPGGYEKVKLALHERALQVGIAPVVSGAAGC